MSDTHDKFMEVEAAAARVSAARASGASPTALMRAYQQQRGAMRRAMAALPKAPGPAKTKGQSTNAFVLAGLDSRGRPKGR